MICDFCSQPAKEFCSKCKIAYYCSADCQSKDWARHKVTHKRKTPTFRFPDSEWNAKEMIDALNKYGYFIIKLSKKEHVDLLIDHREATKKMFECSTSAKSSAFNVTKDKLDKEFGLGYTNHGTFEFVDIRIKENCVDLRPDPSILVASYKPKFFAAYNLCGDISDKAITAIGNFTGVPLWGFSRAGGAPRSLIRSLNYSKPGNWFPAHIDTGYISLSMRANSVGLAIKNRESGKFEYPELTMHHDNELIAISGLDMQALTRKSVQGTIHCVNVNEPRVATVYQVHPGLTSMYIMGAGDDSDDDDFEYFLKKQPKEIK